MFRLHFTSGDLVRLRFAGRPAPLIELVLGLMVLQDNKADIFDQWRQTARRAFPRAAMPLLDLVYPDCAPDYLDSFATDLADGIDEILTSDPDLVRLPYSDGAEHRQIKPWVRELAEGNQDSQRILTTAIQAAYQGMFGRDWHRVEHSHQLDLAFRRPIMAREGIEAAVASVLGVVADRESVTTSGLGRRLGISPGRASEHATVLREAGLISSQRDGKVVLHTPTDLGRSLLSSGGQDFA